LIRIIDHKVAHMGTILKIARMNLFEKIAAYTQIIAEKLPKVLIESIRGVITYIDFNNFEILLQGVSSE